MRFLLLLALLVPQTAAACPEWTLGDALVAVAEGLAGEQKRVSTPLVIPAIGVTREGNAAGASIGWGWGRRQIGGFLPDTTIQRVLVTARHAYGADDMASDRTHVALTYGWFGSMTVFDAGVDLGVATSSLSRVGPFTQVTLGTHGFGVRLAGGVELGDTTHVAASAEIVADVMVLANQL